MAIPVAGEPTIVLLSRAMQFTPYANVTLTVRAQRLIGTGTCTVDGSDGIGGVHRAP
jgi:hypothetical protein